MNSAVSPKDLIPCKVIVVGDSGVGKTSIICRYLNQFRQNEKSTIGASYSNRIEKIDNYNISFDIWDTAGQEKFRSINSIFYRDANVCILVYDITRQDTFDSMKTYWYKTVNELGASGIIYGVAGNKVDKFEDEAVDPKFAKEFANGIDAVFHLTSAYKNTSIDEMFNDLGKRFMKTDTFNYLLKEFKYKNGDDKSQKLTKNNCKKSEKKKKGCC